MTYNKYFIIVYPVITGRGLAEEIMQQSAKTRLRQAMGWIAWAGNAAYTPSKNMSIIGTLSGPVVTVCVITSWENSTQCYLYYPI